MASSSMEITVCGVVNVHGKEGVRLLLEAMNMQTWHSRDPRFKIAPTQLLDVVRFNQASVLDTISWGISTSLKGKKVKLLLSEFRMPGLAKSGHRIDSDI